MFSLILIAVVAVSTAICYGVAKRKNLNVKIWIIYAVCLGPLAMPFVLLAKPKDLDQNGFVRPK